MIISYNNFNEKYILIGKKKIYKYIFQKILYRNGDIIYPFIIQTPLLNIFKMEPMDNNSKYITLSLYLYEFELEYDNFKNYLDKINNCFQKKMNSNTIIYKVYRNYIKINCKLLKSKLLELNIDINKLDNYQCKCIISFELYTNTLNKINTIIYIEDIHFRECDMEEKNNKLQLSKVKFNLNLFTI